MRLVNLGPTDDASAKKIHSQGKHIFAAFFHLDCVFHFENYFLPANFHRIICEGGFAFFASDSNLAGRNTLVTED